MILKIINGIIVVLCRSESCIRPAFVVYSHFVKDDHKDHPYGVWGILSTFGGS